MRIGIILFLFALTSCKSKVDSQLLPGAWRAVENTRQAGLNDYSTITFSGIDSITAKTFAYGKLISEISGKYKIDTKSNILTTSYGDSITYELEIVKLTGNELELYYIKTKQSQRYKRY